MIIGISGKLNSGKDTVGEIVQIISACPHFTDEAVLSLIGQSHLNPKWEIRKFADKLKDIVCLLLNVDRETLEDREFKEKELGEEWDKYRITYRSYSRIMSGDCEFYDEYYTTEQEALSSIKGNLEVEKSSVKIELIKLTPRLLLQLLGTECGREIIHPNIWCNSLMSEYESTIQSTKEEDKRLLSIWKNMNTRCKNPNYEKCHKYGGKGITICKEWEDFQKFRVWALSNGYTNELTLDRINVNGNYEPSNCRFVTSSLQAFNKGSYHQGTSSLKGVNKYSDGRWQAQIQSKGIKKNLGYYQTEEEARKVYQKEYDRINKELEEESFNLQRKCVYPNFIITDTRFKNELKAIEDRAGITIRVNRPMGGSKFEGTQEEWDKLVERNKQVQHESETALDDAEFNYTINNDGTLLELIAKVRQILIEQKILKNE